MALVYMCLLEVIYIEDEDFERCVKQINLFKSKLEEPFVSRSEEALVITLALMTSEHVILVGEPGTAKSALARRAADLLHARFFKYLLTKYTEPDELLGPIDIQAFKEGRYVRVTRNKLPEAEIAFLDEVFNASSAILNTLLSLLNERIIYDGYNEITTPLWTVIAASNRVPEEPEYQALYDRFLLRHFVKPVSEDKWINLLDSTWRIEQEGYRAAKPVLSISDLRTINTLIFRVDVTEVKPKLIKLYAELEEMGIHLTDRRKGKTLKVIAAHALLNGRLKASEEDLLVLKYTAPSSIEDLEKVNVILIEEITSRERIITELTEIEANIVAIKKYVSRLTTFDPKLLEYIRGLERARERIRVILNTPNLDEKIIKWAEKLREEIENEISLIKEMITS